MKLLLLAARISLLAFFILAVSSCGGKREATQYQSNQDIRPLQCVVLLPAEVPYDDTETSGSSKEDLRKGAEFLDLTLKNQLRQSSVKNVVDSSQFKEELEEISGGTRRVLQQVGESARCENVLMTTLRRFDQRQGGQFAVDSPASVAFEVRLLNTVSGNSFWTATFSETQETLFSNLFSFGKARKRGFKWITVEDLASQGVQEKLTECPYLF